MQYRHCPLHHLQGNAITALSPASPPRQCNTGTGPCITSKAMQYQHWLLHHLQGNAIIALSPASPPRQCNTNTGPLTDSKKFCCVDGFLRPFFYAKFQHYWHRNVGLNSSKSRKFHFFGKICPKGQFPLSDFYKNQARGRVFLVCTLTPKFMVVVLKMLAHWC